MDHIALQTEESVCTEGNNSKTAGGFLFLDLKLLTRKKI